MVGLQSRVDFADDKQDSHWRQVVLPGTKERQQHGSRGAFIDRGEWDDLARSGGGHVTQSGWDAALPHARAHRSGL